MQNKYGLEMKSSVFWDIMPCSLSQCFGGPPLPPSSESESKPSKKQAASRPNSVQEVQDLYGLGGNLQANKSAPRLSPR
jgi:hypothetical protein